MKRGLCFLCAVLCCTALVAMIALSQERKDYPVLDGELKTQSDQEYYHNTTLSVEDVVDAQLQIIGVTVGDTTYTTVDQSGLIRYNRQKLEIFNPHGGGPHGHLVTAARQPKNWIPTHTRSGSRACTPPICDGAGWTAEGEPMCIDDYFDEFNGGCNWVMGPYFSTIACNDTICGESGNYLFDGNNYRDTDWYEIEVATDTTLTVTFRADFDAVFGFVEMDRGLVGCADCDEMSGYIAPAWTPPACETAVVEVCVPGQVACDPNNPTVLQNGKYWIFVSTDGYDGVTCGAEYELSLACSPCVVPGCPAGTTLDGQRPNSDVEVARASVFVSDSQFFYDSPYCEENGYERLESFTGISNTVTDLHWWGPSLIYDDDMNLVRCSDPNSVVAHGSNCTHFEITIYPFDPYTNRPDDSTVLFQQRVTAIPVETDLDYWGDLGPVLYWSTNIGPWIDLENLKGWISIVHIGEADITQVPPWAEEPCQFWWHSSPEGGTIHVGLDQRPGDYAEQKDVQGDLAFCLTGIPATLTGACCVATGLPPHCYDDVNVADCMAWGDFFNPNDTCAAWPNEYCEDLPIAACCVGGANPCIDNFTFWYCRLVMFGTWHEGEDCFGSPPFVCPVTVGEASDKCPDDADWKQDLDNSGYVYPSHNAGMQATGGPRAIDNYDLGAGVLRIGWYGLDAENSTTDCDLPNPADFIIRFYGGPNPAGPPDLSSAIEYSVSAYAGETIWAVRGYGTLKYWETYLSSPGPTDGWWSVQSDNITMNDYECLFWAWEGDQTDNGDGYNWFWGGYGFEQTGDGGADPHDTAWCMWSSDTLGWCCHCEDGTCHNEYGSDCTGTDRTFYTDESDCTAACAEADGACCYRSAPDPNDPNIPSCEITKESACAYDWLGCYTTCAECCVPPCCPGSVAEGEPTCTDEYVDTYNGGINSSDPHTGQPIYQSWNMADKICGETGIYQRGGETYRDTDWYKIPVNLTQVEGVIWRVRGEFLQQPIILTDCAGINMPRGDCNCDGSVNALDIDHFVGALTGDPNAIVPPCIVPCAADINCDGSINSLDIDPFIECLTSGCPPCAYGYKPPLFNYEPYAVGHPGKCWPAHPALMILEPGDVKYLLFYVSTYTDEYPEPTGGTAYNGSIEFISAGSCTIGDTVCSLRTKDVCEALGGVFVDGAQCLP